ncbi:MAG: hypothetical protein ACYTHJ_18710 [Planctomycetota bacterium]
MRPGHDQPGLESLHALAAELCDDYAWADAGIVSADVLPGHYRELLVHNEHMTTTLGSFHDDRVRLRVLKRMVEGDLYLRMIQLVAGPDDKVVEFGILRFNLATAPLEVRREVEAASTPLGDILIKHGVMREIEPRWFVQIDGRSPLVEQMGFQAGENLFGRIGRIHCDGHPAIELLEVVTETRASTGG